MTEQAARKQPLRILVTEAQELAALGAIRSLGAAGHRVVASFPSALERPPSAYSRFCAGSLEQPDPWTQQMDFRSWLLDQVETGDYDVLLPITEAAVFAASELGAQLASHVRILMPNAQSRSYSLSKYRATMAAGAAGLEIPPTVYVQEPGNPGVRKDGMEALRFPVILKHDNYLRSDGVYVKGRRGIVRHAREALALLEEWHDVSGGIVAQEWIPGRGTGVFLLRERGRTRLAFAHRRLHEIPHTGGYSALRESVRDPEGIERAEKLLDSIQYEGVAMVEFRCEQRAGTPYFLEINGRLWGSIALALHAGIDFPRAMLEGASEVSYAEGIRCQNFALETKHLRSFGDRSLGRRVARWLGVIVMSLDPRVRHDYFWWRDPLPAWALHRVRWRAALGGLAQWTRSASARRKRERQGALALPRQPRHFLFLCFGNICRSPFAEVYWNRSVARAGVEFPQASSAGFHPDSQRRTPSAFQGLAKDFALDLSGHRSSCVTRERCAEADAIFVMDDKNYDELLRQFPEFASKTFHLAKFSRQPAREIQDPYGRSAEEARRCYEQIGQALDGLFERVTES